MNENVRKLLDSLNEQQRCAAQHDQGPLIVLAGPGSGKTRTLTARIAYILEKHSKNNFKILALTFSRKAADELRERVENILGYNTSRRLFIGTYHSFCLDILRSYGHYLGLNKEFTIYENNEELISLLINAVTEQVNKEFLNSEKEPILLAAKFNDYKVTESVVPKFYYSFTNLKKRLEFPEDLEKYKNKYSEEFKFIYRLYVKTLRDNSAMDFYDLIYYTCKLFREKPFLLKRYQSIYKYIMVDEGQDTTKNQFELLKLLTGNGYKNIFIVADEDQLIYEWNDARFEYLIELQKIHQAEIIQLFLNYRCPPEIIELANTLIVHNKNRLENKIRTCPIQTINNKTVIQLNSLPGPTAEIDWVTESLQKHNKNSAIIARNRAILERFAHYFEQNKIDYYKTYSQARFNTDEFQALINFLYLLSNEDDSVHLKYLCTYLNINIEDVIISSSEETKLIQLINYLKDTKPELANFLEMIQNLKKSIFGFEKIKSLLKVINSDSNLTNEFYKSDLEYFKDLLDKYKNGNTEPYSIKGFLANLALSPKPVREKGVALLTGHGAKGLEFNTVYIVSLNQGIWPDFRAENDTRKLEEERRNLFVAITRAKERLFISYTHQKDTRFGLRKQEPSQFLAEMGLI